MKVESEIKKITGIGVDIESISKFREMPFKNHKRFYEKVFTPQEIEYCLSKFDPSQHFATRFCAKEAFIKAINQKVSYKSIEIFIKDNKPSITWKNYKIFLSLAHEEDKAIAFVLILSEK